MFIEAFDRLKRDGKVRAVGVSTNELDYIEHFDRDGGLDAVQLDYSILNREPEREVLILVRCAKTSIRGSSPAYTST